VRRFQTIFLTNVLILLLPFAVYAADEAEQVDATKASSGAIVEDATTRMLRQTHSVKGYQPLTVAGVEIGATYLEETLGERHGAIILLHDKGEQFEGQGVVTPLRHHLPEHGWSTLTVAFDYPFEANITLSQQGDATAALNEDGSAENEGEQIAETDANETVSEDSEASDEQADLPPVSNQQRLAAAVSFLQAKDINRYVILGHGVGAVSAVELVATLAVPPSALILVGMPALSSDGQIENINIPILDLFGEKDFQAVTEAVTVRKALMKRNKKQYYEVREVLGANHVYYGLEASLKVAINGWLYKYFIREDDN